MERRWSVKPLVRVTAEVRFLSSAFEKECGVEAALRSPKPLVSVRIRALLPKFGGFA